MSLTQYRTLGRSGLVVSPLALGTMTFGTARWGSGDSASRDVFDAYLDAGGNFVDTADVYSGGRSEEMLGQFISAHAARDSIVIATKSGFATGPGVHMGGNGAKHVRAALEGSLKRLRTDYVDLLWVHVWDSVTPAHELLETMSNLIKAGKVRHWGLSNTPAWYVAQVATLAAASGKPAPIALQYFYSLVNRDIEEEFVPLAAEFGMAIQPWSPLAFGLLTGKYDRTTVEAAAPRDGGLPREAARADAERPADDKRLDGANPFGDSLFTDRNWAIVETVKRVAAECGESAARVALAWVVQRPGVTSTLMGVSKIEQLQDNMAALEIRLSDAHVAQLDQASATASRLLYSLFTPSGRQHAVFGGSPVRPWSASAPTL
ncbi:MAG: aldo/keto reductase [Aquincola tertiaricarbonis]|uniref:aldo/keto reductase n=1 Tax=Aquincola tertiaricarbonis TaxID=391953 RepID=UPI000614A2E3|nr:aldo/keto reductase [Aquincola tertiaricarbonis]